MAVYTPGQLVRLSVAFTVAGTATDPTTISVVVRTPDGRETTYTYALAQVVKDGVGNYHYDFPASLIGYHYYRWVGAGTVIAASESSFGVVSNL